MIYDSFNFIRIKNPVHSSAYQIIDRNRRCDFMTENPVQLENMNTLFRAVHPMGIKNLFSNCLSHTNSLSFLLLGYIRRGASGETPRKS